MDLPGAHNQTNIDSGATVAHGEEDEWLSPLFRDLFEDDLSPLIPGKSPDLGFTQPVLNGSSLQKHLNAVCPPGFESNSYGSRGDPSVFDFSFMDAKKKEGLGTSGNEPADFQRHVEVVAEAENPQQLSPGRRERPEFGENPRGNTYQAPLEEATTANWSRPACGEAINPQQSGNSFALPPHEKGPLRPFLVDSPDSLYEILNFRQVVRSPPGDFSLPPPAIPRRDADFELLSPVKGGPSLLVPQSAPGCGSLRSPKTYPLDAENPVTYAEPVVSKAEKPQIHTEHFGRPSLMRHRVQDEITESKHPHGAKKCTESPARDIFEASSCPPDTTGAHSCHQFPWEEDAPVLPHVSSPSRYTELLFEEDAHLPVASPFRNQTRGASSGLDAVEPSMMEDAQRYQQDMRKSQELMQTASIPPAYPSVPGAEPLPPQITESRMPLPKRRAKKTRNKARKWTPDEQARFEFALETWGRDWEACARHVGTRDISLIRSHAQKHFIKLYKTGQPLPLRVADSGPGYTLSGNVLRDDSPSARSYLTGINAPGPAATTPKHSPPCSECAGRVDSSQFPRRGSALAPLDTNLQPCAHHGCGGR